MEDFCFEYVLGNFYRGNGDSIKHAHQLITTLLKNIDADLTSLVPSKNKSRSTTVTSSHDNETETIKTQRANTGPRLQQTNGKIFLMINI